MSDRSKPVHRPGVVKYQRPGRLVDAHEAKLNKVREQATRDQRKEALLCDLQRVDQHRAEIQSQLSQL